MANTPKPVTKPEVKPVEKPVVKPKSTCPTCTGLEHKVPVIQ